MNKVSPKLLIFLAFVFAVLYPVSALVSIVGGLFALGLALLYANDKVKKVCLEPLLIVLTIFVVMSVFTGLFNLINYFVVLFGGSSVAAFNTILLVINILCYIWAAVFYILSIIYNLKGGETPLYSRFSSFLIDGKAKSEPKEDNEEDEE